MAYIPLPVTRMGLIPYSYSDECNKLIQLFKRYMVYSGHKLREEIWQSVNSPGEEVLSSYLNGTKVLLRYMVI